MSDNRSEWAVGFAFLAGIIMIMIGFFAMIEGLAAVFRKDFYAVSANYVFHSNVSAWGWIHMLLGLIILLAGLGVFKGAVWARTLGVIMAALIAIANFAFIPIYPVFAIVIIATCIFVIWALTAHGRDLAQ